MLRSLIFRVNYSIGVGDDQFTRLVQALQHTLKYTIDYSYEVFGKLLTHSFRNFSM